MCCQVKVIVIKNHVAPFTGAWIEIFATDRQLQPSTESHPSRVRGLKCWKAHSHPALSGVAPFTGAWIEINRRCGDVRTSRMSHPSRVRGLKSSSCRFRYCWISSHPSRVRGLKFVLTQLMTVAVRVAPFTGAWIEIWGSSTGSVWPPGRTLHGCVD